MIQGSTNLIPETLPDPPVTELRMRLNSLVCEHGPLLLTDGMQMYDAVLSIIACIEHLLTTRVPVELLTRMEFEMNEEQTRRRMLEKKLAAVENKL